MKQVKCSADFSTIFVYTNKTTQPHPQVFLVNGALICKNAALKHPDPPAAPIKHA